MQASRIDGEELSKVAEKEWKKRELEESNGVSSIFARNHEGYMATRSTSQIMVPEMVTKNTLSAETTEYAPVAFPYWKELSKVVLMIFC